MPALNGFAFALGDLVLGLEDRTGEWRKALLPRYGEFECAHEPDVVLEMETPFESAPAEGSRAERLLAEPITIALHEGQLEIESASIRCDVDLRQGRGRLRAPLHRHGVDVAARALLAALRPDALLVHAALAVDGGRAFVLAGPSGAGKSTIAALLGDRARCDELVRLDRAAAGWRAEALPFWHGRRGGGALAAIRLLRQAPSDSCVALGRGEAVRRLAAEIVWPSFSEARVARTLAQLERLVDEVTIGELRFRPTPEVWSHIEGPVAGVAA